MGTQAETKEVETPVSSGHITHPELKVAIQSKPEFDRLYLVDQPSFFFFFGVDSNNLLKGYYDSGIKYLYKFFEVSQCCQT
jgi:hypothetical protein